MSKPITSLSDLSPDRTNANKGTQRGRGMVEASLRETGAGRSIVVDKDGRIIAGNKTLEAWADIGGEIEVIRTDGKRLVVVQRDDLDLSDDTGQARKLAYYDNRAGEVGLEWDTEQLLADLNAGVDLSGMFRDDELDELLAGMQGAGDAVEDVEPQIDRAEELRAKWGVESGQMWQMGEHRIVCGDSSSAEVINRLMSDDRASLVFTDPPYGVAIGAKNRLLNSVQKAGWNLTDIEDDSLSPTELKAQLLPVFNNIRALVMAEDCTVFVTAPQGGELSMMMMMMEEAKLRVRHVLIWKKNQPTFSMGRLDYDYQHEPILLTWGKRHKRPMKGEHRTSIWEIDKPRASPDHPTMKPVELVINALLNNSDAGDIVFDAYSGSGTTLMACEMQGRKARVSEISPAYVAVALQRWADATGREPVRME